MQEGRETFYLGFESLAEVVDGYYDGEGLNRASYGS